MLYSVIIIFQIYFCIFVLGTNTLFQNTNRARIDRHKFNVIRYRRQIQNTTCPTTKFRCNSGQCIDDIKLCDGNGDCDDNSDENVKVCNLQKCPGIAFMCKYGACIHINGRCNGLRDCLDGSDEEFCPLTIINNMNSSIIDGCQLPDNPLHGEYVVINHLSVRYNPGDIAPVFSVLSLNCNKGYFVDPSEDDSLSYCLPTKKWNSTPKVCTRLSLFSAGCRLPYNPSHGKYVVINHLSGGYNPGDIVPVYSLLSVYCNSGYVINPLEDDIPSYCLPTEEWIPAPKSCSLMSFVSKGCQVPNNPLYGQYVVNNNLSSNGYNPGDTVPVNTILFVNCKTGYQIDPPGDDKPSICLPTEVWRPPPQNCVVVPLERKRCRFLTNPQHGRYIINHNLSSYYSPGDLVPFEAVLSLNCTIGYAVDPPESDTLSYCSVTGEWMPVPKTCARVCPSLISKGKTKVACEFNGTLLNSCSNVIENTVARLSCEPFYEELSMERHPFRLCQNGSWGSPIPQCYPICGKKRVTSDIIHGSNNVYTATLGHHPWRVNIINFSPTHRFVCSGSILNERIVLSEALCFVDHNGQLYNKSEYVILNGNIFSGYYRVFF